jgi:hypothetical protein
MRKPLSRFKESVQCIRDKEIRRDGNTVIISSCNKIINSVEAVDIEGQNLLREVEARQLCKDDSVCCLVPSRVWTRPNEQRLRRFRRQ